MTCRKHVRARASLAGRDRAAQELDKEPLCRIFESYPRHKELCEYLADKYAKDQGVWAPVARAAYKKGFMALVNGQERWARQLIYAGPVFCDPKKEPFDDIDC